MATEQSGAESLAELFQKGSDEFDKLTQERHEAGAKEYGVFTFAGNDVVRMMMEELADTANYCRYQYIKLMLLQELLEAEVAEKLGDTNTKMYGDIEIGTESFKGVGTVGWSKA